MSIAILKKPIDRATRRKYASRLKKLSQFERDLITVQYMKNVLNMPVGKRISFCFHVLFKIGLKENKNK